MKQFTDVLAFVGENKDVKKFVFTNKQVVAEAVLYKYGLYEDRTVLCISTQCGCPVGCTFCGTGEKFIRNLTKEEIVEQVEYITNYVEEQHNIHSLNDRCAKFQIMFMSMGEPMLNWAAVGDAVFMLHDTYPNAELLISTMGVDNDTVFGDILKTSKWINKVGLQFSVHSLNQDYRNSLIPFQKKMGLNKLAHAGLTWWATTGRKVYLNFCIDDDTTLADFDRMEDLFPSVAFALTFSVICDLNKDNPSKDDNIAKINSIVEHFSYLGYNVRKFDPAGQDDIGAGCGQLWYVQEWMNKK